MNSKKKELETPLFISRYDTTKLVNITQWQDVKIILQPRCYVVNQFDKMCKLMLIYSRWLFNVFDKTLAVDIRVYLQI